MKFGGRDLVKVFLVHMRPYLRRAVRLRERRNACRRGSMSSGDGDEA